MAASVVLNGSRSSAGVSEATRQRILSAASELGYSANVTARGLRNVRFKCLGVSCGYTDPFSTPDPRDSTNTSWMMADYYGSYLLNGILRAAHNRGYNVMHFHKAWRDAAHSAAGFRGQGIDGFLIIAPDPDSDMVSGLSALGIPAVVISSSSDQHGVPSVDVDNAAAVRMVLDHLLALGHRRIGYLMEPSDQVDHRIRRDSFLQGLRDSGLPAKPEYMVVASDADFKERVRALLTGPEPPSAVFACDDRTAIRLIQLAHEIGLRVPQDLSIVGFDDSPAASVVTPPLTTVRQPLSPMAEKATDLLISLVEEEPVATQTHWFDPVLVVRESTSPPIS
jgi:LacI family transcriptional regulator